jgi:hypothetical protein
MEILQLVVDAERLDSTIENFLNRKGSVSHFDSRPSL